MQYENDFEQERMNYGDEDVTEEEETFAQSGDGGEG